jgi:hypothetical protein
VAQVVEHKALSSNPNTSNIKKKKTLRVNLGRQVFMYRIAIASPPDKEQDWVHFYDGKYLFC